MAVTPLSLQVFERANMLVMLYHVDDASTACCVPVEPLKRLLPMPTSLQTTAES